MCYVSEFQFLCKLSVGVVWSRFLVDFGWTCYGS